MLIGLLEAETLPEKVVKEFGSYGNMFERLLKQSQPDLTFRYYAADQGQLPADLDECDAYILTGSRFNAYDTDPWIENLKALIREIDANQKKCLGICFGHQLIAEALGGKVERSEKGWGVGAAEFEIYQQTPYLEEFGNKYSVLVSHQDQVIRLPTGAKHLAGNDFCPFGAYSIGKHIFSMQGHPEFSSAYLQRLIVNRLSTIRADKSETALKSIERFKGKPNFSKLLMDFIAFEPSLSLDN